MTHIHTFNLHCKITVINCGFVFVVMNYDCGFVFCRGQCYHVCHCSANIWRSYWNIVSERTGIMMYNVIVSCVALYISQVIPHVVALWSGFGGMVPWELNICVVVLPSTTFNCISCPLHENWAPYICSQCQLIFQIFGSQEKNRRTIWTWGWTPGSENTPWNIWTPGLGSGGVKASPLLKTKNSQLIFLWHVFIPPGL